MSCPANVSTNVTSQEFSELGQEESRSLELEVWPWVVKFVQWSMCVVGMVGNWSVVVVYKTKKSFNRTASENFILLMAVFDLSMCLLTLFFTASQQYLLPLNCFLFCASGNFSFDFINTSSSMLMIVITLNRFVAVCYPHSYKSFFSEGRTRLCLSVCVISGLINTPVGVLMCRKFITPSDLECGCHEVIHPAPKVAVLKLIWVLTRAVMMFVNSANMAYCYCKIYQKMVAKMKSRDHNKTSFKNIRKAMEDEEHEFTTKAVVNKESDPLSSCRVNVTPGVKNGKKAEIMVGKIEAENHPKEMLQKPKFESAASSVRRENTCRSTVISTAVPDYTLIGEQNISREVVCSKKSTPLFKTSSSRSKDQKLTTTLFAVSIAYVILVTPDLIIHVMDVFALLQDNKFQNFRTVTQTLYLINFVINPFIHALVNSYYKEQVKRSYKSCCSCFMK